MNGTLMFGGDRFGPDQDYAATYRSLGGSELAPAVVKTIVQTCYTTMGAIYDDPSRSDSFPRVLDTLRTLPAARGLPEAELELLERVIAHQEVGRIPDGYAEWVRSAARSHVLGLIANLLSRKDLWVQEFKRAGVLDCFRVMIFSSWLPPEPPLPPPKMLDPPPPPPPRPPPPLLLLVMLKSGPTKSGTSTIKSLVMKVKFGRLRPFMYLAAVWESAVTRIGSAMVASQLT